MALWHYQSRFSVCNLLPLIAQLIQSPLDCFCGKVSGMHYIFTSIAENRYSHSYSKPCYSYSHTRSPHSHHYSHYRRTTRRRHRTTLSFHFTLKMSLFDLCASRRFRPPDLRKSKAENRYAQTNSKPSDTYSQTRSPHPHH